MRIIFLPLQPLDERYTGMWYDIIPKAFRDRGHEVVVVDGEVLEREIVKGSFLDVYGALYWELTQLEKFVKMAQRGEIERDDVVFLSDIEFPGLAIATKFISRLSGIGFKAVGWLHAGSYVKGDFSTLLEDYQKWLEVGWLSGFDKIFVASNYHKRILFERRLVPMGAEDLIDKVVVTGNPWSVEWAYKIAGIESWEEIDDVWRDIDVIISQRPDPDKGVNRSLAIVLKLLADYGLKIFFTTGRRDYVGYVKWIADGVKGLSEIASNLVKVKTGVSKMDYYWLLMRSKVMLSNAIEENFGYCIVEALAFGCAPVVPNRCSYPEILFGDERFIFDDEDEAVDKVISWIMSRKCGVKEMVEISKRHEENLKRVVREVEKLES